MRVRLPTVVMRKRGSRSERLQSTRFFQGLACMMAWLFAVVFMAAPARAQVNVVTAHNDIARTGQNLNETILTPLNVNPNQFGKLFSQPTYGLALAQPLYVSNVTIPGLGTHNVVYVSTQADTVYAFDADTNGGSNGKPLWMVSFLTNTAPAGTYTNNHGIIGTPVIDLGSGTMYVVSSDYQSGVATYRLHALDITTGAEKFNGPFLVQASVPGTGAGSVGGVLNFDPSSQTQHAGLLLLHGVLYTAYSSVNDEGVWHGWILSYNASTLQPINVFCTSPNGTEAGIWMAGAGLAAEVSDPTKPYGRMFVPTANGTYQINAPTVAGQPYSNPLNSYGMSVLDLDLTGGVMTVEDIFTPFNEAVLNSQDADLGSGGPVLLPTQTLASGNTVMPLVEVGKSGKIYILDRNNLGGFHSGGDQVVQEVQTPEAGADNWGEGVWGTEAYWNNNIYSGGTNSSPDSLGSYSSPEGTGITAYSFVNGVLSTTPTSTSQDLFEYPPPTPSISANQNTNGLVWVMMNNGWNTGTPTQLLAYDATNLSTTLYSTLMNPSRDTPSGTASPHTVPTIANGKVYVATRGYLSVYGLLGVTPVAPEPIISPSNPAPFTGTQVVSMSDTLAGATIYYTTNGTIPVSTSAVYTKSFTISATETITAVASLTGYDVSPPVSVNFVSKVIPAIPVFSLAAGTYTGAQTLTITDSTPGAIIYYTIDGPAPTTASAIYSQPLTISASQTVQAIAVSTSGFSSSAVSAAYTIFTIDFTQGFSIAQGPMQFNGSTNLDDFRLQLTSGASNQAGSAFFATPVNIQSFTTDFTFQLSNPAADGMTFTIQNNSPGALGSSGGGLGFHGLPQSVAVKFDLYSNNGEGPDSTGVYINGAWPMMPAIDLSSTGINLHSGDYFNAHITYDGANLSVTITDAVTLASWSQSFPINIPSIVGGNTAYVGFTGGTGGSSSSQKLTSWTYAPGMPTPDYSGGFNGSGLTLNGGATQNGANLQLTDGGINEARSAFFSSPVNIQRFSTSFQFQLINPTSDGFTFTIQNSGATAVGSSGGGLGYWKIPASVAVKFDLFNNSGEGPDSTGLYVGGAFPGANAIDLSSTGINLHSGDIFNAQLTYDGTTLTVVITDTVTNASVTQTYTINIPVMVGGPTAYVGFTGSTGSSSAIQNIQNWSYSALPLVGPAYYKGFTASQSQMTLNGVAQLNGTKLRLTNGLTKELGSAFYNTPLNVQQFITSFNFQLASPTDGGITFTIQNNNPTEIGSQGGGGVYYEGGGLGYFTIPNSVAIKFDLFSNAGEGPDSTGLYTNGIDPTFPLSTDLSTTGINLHSGDIFNAQIAYNGTTVTVVITDTVTNASATQTYTINIPATIGGNTAYVGFTGGTDNGTATQDILNWTFSGGALN